ncbi:XRE family transcriptional regulator [Lactobacillus delbrueckii subsp. lactis]|uniref:helix-turn-helix domain-containing protein n=1 Tax=Lactobacillus delbrueckii TaxID=1584 RepID=UPI00288B4D91|nr:helix-turn-helix transcriptional regulator [Lactobacillus delbrueckii]MCT3475627.1 XRE family transcriptional regulator [Lactobacillus delbrueckii subsp. lactis]
MWNEIEKILKKKKMSIYKLAKLTGIPDTSLHNYKNGSQLSFVNVCKIADALGVSLDDLRGGNEDGNSCRQSRASRSCGSDHD